MLKQNQPFSMGWVLASIVVFVLAQLVLAVIVGQVLIGSRIPTGMHQVVQGLLILISYFVGGFVIGVISPKIRIIEPALGAFASIFLVVLVSFVMPNSYIYFNWLKMFIGGAIAFALAMYGATLGEKLTKQM